MPLVKDIMTNDVVKIEVHKTIFDAAILMTEKQKGCLVILDNKRPIGMVTERDFVRRVTAKKIPVNTKISQIMSEPLITIDAEASLKEAARLMVNNKIRRLPVVTGNKLVGILVVSDFARQLSKKTITEEILEAMARYYEYPTRI